VKRHRLRGDLTIVEQTYRGETSYVVKDRAAQKYYRFKPLEALVMQQFSGEHTAAEIAAALAEQGVPLKPAAVEGFARKLDQMGLLERSVAEKSVLLMERLRAERNRRVRRTHYTGSILRMRWSVGNPDAFFNRWMPRLRFCFSRPFLIGCVALFGVYFAIVLGNWPSFVTSLASMYSFENLTLGAILVFWVTVMTVIVIHELGHGFTCKYFGGEVHEMGAMLIYFQPAFYCNVNDAWTFPDKRARLWVTAAGSWIQMAVSGIAAVIWVTAQPGTVIWQAALSAVLFGGAVTVLANMNPLIPLDGYYALCDAMEMPNLRKRAFQYVGWLFKREVLRLEVPEPDVDERERRTFVTYGLLAIAYSTTILAVVLSRVYGWLSAALGTVGILAFALLVWNVIRRHVHGWTQALTTSLREHRNLWGSKSRWSPVLLALATLLLLLAVAPWPIRVDGTFRAGGLSELALTAPHEGVLARIYADEGTLVPAGAPVVAIWNPELQRRALELRRLADSLTLREQQARGRGAAAEARFVEAERLRRAAELASLEARLGALTLRAPVAARVATPRLGEMVGRRIEAGDTAVLLLGGPDSLRLSIALERAGATLVRPDMPVELFPFTNPGAGARARVAGVSAVATGGAGPGEITVWAIVPFGSAFRPGGTGEARIAVRRSSVLGAVWWAVRKRFRNDLLL
jgi:multidrug efflux pump subunit AcrA (membrane-fusion protein)